jgi:hypothetical protein
VFTAVLKVGIRLGLDTLRSLCVCGWLPQMAEKAPRIDIFRGFRTCGKAIRG